MVQVLEYNPTIGGRCWTLRGGDTYTEMGGFTQNCEFATGTVHRARRCFGNRGGAPWDCQ